MTQREIPDFGNRRKLLHFCNAQPQSSQNFTSDLSLSAPEDTIAAFLDVQVSDCNVAFFSLGEKLHNGRFPFRPFSILMKASPFAPYASRLQVGSSGLSDRVIGRSRCALIAFTTPLASALRKTLNPLSPKSFSRSTSSTPKRRSGLSLP